MLCYIPLLSTRSGSALIKTDLFYSNSNNRKILWWNLKRHFLERMNTFYVYLDWNIIYPTWGGASGATIVQRNVHFSRSTKVVKSVCKIALYCVSLKCHFRCNLNYKVAFYSWTIHYQPVTSKVLNKQKYLIYFLLPLRVRIHRKSFISNHCVIIWNSDCQGF